MTAFSVQAIANYFIRQARKEQNLMTHLKVQKLVYLAHGWSLALMERPLIADPVEAWEYGPTYPGLYKDLKKHGPNPIQEEIKALVFSENSLDWKPASIEEECNDAKELAETRELLDKIWNVHKSWQPKELSAIAHQEGTPWYRVNSEYPCEQERYKRIPDRLIQSYFCMKAEESQ